jgi:hypothetical protein
MPECFVIQPFDNGKFDQRYKDNFKPAIEGAGLTPYRVDEDPSVDDLLVGIKEGIRRASAFLADVTLDNPNVWYELGHAMAAGIPFCVICSDERTGPYPFDVGHLKIIAYKTGASSYYAELQSEITNRLKAAVDSQSNLLELATSQEILTGRKGLSVHEQMVLSILFEEHFNVEAGASHSSLTESMERAGATKVATNLAILKLEQKDMIGDEERQYEDFNRSEYKVFFLKELGIKWITENQDQLVLNTRRSRTASHSTEGTDDDIPF